MSTTNNAFNTQSQDATTGKQQQQPGYLDKAYNLLGSLSGSTDNTTNSRNQQPHVGGVGDMSTKSGSDVARPAEERANPNPFTSGGTSESIENPNISDPNSIQQRLNARNPPNPYPEGNTGAGLSSDKQFHNKQDHVGGVGDLGTRSDADVVRLPEERANPDPLASAPGATNPFKDTTTGAATGFASTRDHNRDTTDTADTTGTQSHGWKPEQKSWDTRNVAGTLHDPTQHGHSGGVTGSNIDTDHGLGMPHRDDTQRGNRDEGAIGQHQQKWTGATDFQPGRDGGFNADTRDQGVNERTQAPVGTTTSTHRHPHLHRDDEPLNADTRDQGMNDRTQAPFGGVDQSTTSTHRHHDRDNEALNAGNRDQGMNERTRAPVGGVDHTTTSTHRHHDRDHEMLDADTRDRGAHDRTLAPLGGVDNTTTSTQRHHDRDNEMLGTDTRDRGVHDRTQAPIAGVDNTTTSTHRHHDRDNEMLGTDTKDRGAHDRTQAPLGGVDNTTTSTHRHHDRDDEALNRDRGAHDRTQAPVGGVDHTTTSAHRHPDRDVAMEERRDEDENASPTGKPGGPGKLDKLHGKFMVAKGKLTKDPEAIAQGERLQTEGVTIRASDILDERRE